MSAREKLTRLIELATKDSPEDRRALAGELCDLLRDWPDNYPANMREPFEALLEKTLRLIDRQTRNALVDRIAEWPQPPLELLNEFYFDAPDTVRARILTRNAYANRDAEHDAEPADLESVTRGAHLVNAARTKSPAEFADAMVSLFALDPALAEDILFDATGEGLAILAKGARLGRAAFSALVLLTAAKDARGEAELRLAAFDSVPQAGAESLLKFWQSRSGAALHAHAA